jgi:hypothetical protein
MTWQGNRRRREEEHCLVNIFDNSALRSNIFVCSGCNRTCCPTDIEDLQDHARYHAEYERITRSKKHRPLTYAAREQLKVDARALLLVATSIESIRVAAKMLVLAHYDRSLERAIAHGMGDLHPSLPGYARTISEDGQFESRVNAALQAEYQSAPRASGTIESTLWDPPSYVHQWAMNPEVN